MTEHPLSENADAPSTDPLPFTPEQIRILGCLIEKEHTTPDYYPLTLNALVTACNQSTNRDPVVSYEERFVMEAVEQLKTRQYVFQLTMAGARVQKFRHNLGHKFPQLERPEIALLTTLLLRGAQTIGELRQRSERIFAFDDLQAVEDSLRKLIGSDLGEPLVVCFPPGPGRKSALYMHTLGGKPDAPTTAGPGALPVTIITRSPGIDEDWKAKIEAEIAALKAEIADLRAGLTTSSQD